MIRDKFQSSTEGSMALSMAAAVPVLMLVVGGTIDYARFLETRTEVAARVDAAAVHAANAFLDSSADPKVTEARVRSEVTTMLADLKPAGASAPNVTFDQETKRADVDVGLEMPSTFTSLFGIGTFRKSIHAAAVAESEDQPVCILALAPNSRTGITFFGKGEVKARDCVVWSNAPSAQSIMFQGNGKVTASRICARGRAGALGGFDAKPLPEDNCPHVSDPLAGFKPPDIGKCTSTGNAWVSRVTAQLNPGVYCGGLRVDAKNIFLSPGVYVIKDGPLILRGESKISGKNVGFYLTGNDTEIRIDGRSKTDLTSMMAGPMAGIVMAAAPNSIAEDSEVTGRADLKIGGVIYLPTHNLTYWGESDTRAASPVTTIIANTIKIGGTAFLEVKNDKKKAKNLPMVSTNVGVVRLVE